MHALIPAAGRGVRYGSGENKIFASLAGLPVLVRTVQAFLRCKAVDSVIIVGRGDELDRLRDTLAEYSEARAVQFCEGGASRQESVSHGLDFIVNGGGQPDDIVLVHDAARPLISTALVERCIEDARKYGSAIAAYPIADTIKRVSPDEMIVEQTLPRDNLWAAQTPQAASIQALRTSHSLASRRQFAGTDEASLLEQDGIQPRIVLGERANLKITTQDDLIFAETLLAADTGPAAGQSRVFPFRIGMGYDIHQLIEGRRLVLGGVEIAHSHGLLGHSDADVVLHAICDALLGAAALPDIGHFFPNDDPRYAGADSIELLRAVHGAISNANYRIGNIDACVIAEQPKISPFVSAMKRRIAEALQIGEDAVSVKATTNEKIGSLGAGEGIACHATALIMRME